MSVELVVALSSFACFAIITPIAFKVVTRALFSEAKNIKDSVNSARSLLKKYEEMLESLKLMNENLDKQSTYAISDAKMQAEEFLAQEKLRLNSILEQEVKFFRDFCENRLKSELNKIEKSVEKAVDSSLKDILQDNSNNFDRLHILKLINKNSDHA